jgi:hypothetical protein
MASDGCADTLAPTVRDDTRHATAAARFPVKLDTMHGSVRAMTTTVDACEGRSRRVGAGDSGVHGESGKSQRRVNSGRAAA